MFGWPLIIVLVFLVVPPRRAVIFSFLAGWMFLPDVVFELPGLPDYGKMMAATVSALVGALVFDTRTVLSYRPSWADVPMFIWCLCPFVSSITNGLGVYDGASGVFHSVAKWGVPYLLGRVYLRDLTAFRELATMLFVAGLIYVPLCIFEIRMSPQLNKLVYGFGNVSGGGEYREEFGAWGSRPRVFMGTGLALGTFMTATSLMGVWLWYTRALKRLRGYPVGPLVGLLVVTAFACKNVGALALLIFGLTALFSIRILRGPLLIYALILAAPAYMGLRATGSWSADSMVELASMIHEKRGMSLNGRLVNDSMLAEKALQRPVFGWGGWGRSRIYDEKGRDISVTDGEWIIVLGVNGVAGLTAFTIMLLLPPTLMVARYRAVSWLTPQVGPAGAAAVLVVLYMIDNLFNAMFNPVYVVAAAGLVTVSVCRTRDVLVPARQPVSAKPLVAVGVHHP